MRRLSIFISSLLLLAAMIAVAKPPDAQTPWFTATLQKERIATSPETLIKELRERTIGAENIAQIDAVVKKLGSPKFQDRQEASQKLLKIGPAAALSLRKATHSTDLEVATRARIILTRLKSPEQFERDREIVFALLKQIARDNVGDSLPLVLQILPQLDSIEQRYAAQEAIWQTAQNKDRDRFEAVLESADPTLRATAVAAISRLDKSRTDKKPAAEHQHDKLAKISLPTIPAFLEDPSAEVRLAACRALVNDEPRRCLPILIELAEQKESLVRDDAWKLLEALTNTKHNSPEKSHSEKPSTFWPKTVADFDTDTKFPTIKDELRFRWGNEIAFVADFSRAADFGQNFGPFKYSGPDSGTAKVVDGQLILSGKHDAPYQYVELSALASIGRPEFPARFRVDLELGGGIQQRGEWQMGIVIGNQRITFCPGYVDGFVTFMRDDNNQSTHDYEPLGFTPTADLLHSISVLVSQVNPDFVELDIAIVDQGLSHKSYRKKLLVKRSDIAKINRIALIRIGEPGGNAMFRNLTIKEEM